MMIAVLLAGGSGSRFASDRPKQFVLLNGRPLLEYSIDIIVSLKFFDRIILVINKKFEKEYSDIIIKYDQHIDKVEGGETRQLSVFNALLFAEENFPTGEKDVVLIHDCARPFSRKVFENVIREMENEQAVIPSVPLVDTIYRCEGNRVSEIPPREQFVNVQTPQGFRFSGLLDCHKKAYDEKNVSYSDDGSLYMACSGCGLKITEGDRNNFKITKAVDLEIAQYLLRTNQV